MKNLSLMLVVAGMLMFTAQAEAQFSGLKKSVPGASSSEPSSSVSQESIILSYIEANRLVLGAQAKLADAFGLKEEAAKARAAAEALQSLSTDAAKEQLESGVSVSDEVMAAVKEEIDKGTELSEEGRASYVEGLALAAQSVMATKNMAQDAKEFSTSARSEIKSASMMKKAGVTKKFSAGMFVVEQLPGYTSRLTENFGALASYAKSANIPVPDDATDILASL